MSVATPSLDPLEAFKWEPQPQAFALVCALVFDFLQRNPFAQNLSDRMIQSAGVRFVDCVDHIALPATDALRQRLIAAGFVRDEAGACSDRSLECYAQPRGIFPGVLLYADDRTRLALKVESVADFLATWQLDPSKGLEGAPLDPMRRAFVSAHADTEFYVIERHGHRGIDPAPWPAARRALVLSHLEAFRTRRRDFPDDADGFAHAGELIDHAIDDVGQAYACDLFFQAERDFWMRRNRAARVQHARQQRLGIGWANHDHHTYRASRRHFTKLIGTWEKLGFQLRERYHAGRQAGWGAQIVEHPATNIICFNDVDLTPEELFNDFAHEPLPERASLGTVGLWCGLHGDSFLQAGMHHLECMFSFDHLRDQLASDADIKTMKPFTDFPYLRQAFTEGERWPVAEGRLRRLSDAGLITPEQATQFRQQGALGSHLENLERNDGFKGFNQTGVSEIIAATDPRKQVKQHA